MTMYKIATNYKGGCDGASVFDALCGLVRSSKLPGTRRADQRFTMPLHHLARLQVAAELARFNLGAGFTRETFEQIMKEKYHAVGFDADYPEWYLAKHDHLQEWVDWGVIAAC